MRTSATRIGRTVPTEFSGTVRAVWRRALAVAPDPVGGADPDALIALVREDVPMTAASIALHLDPTFDFAASGWAAGDRVRWDDESIEIQLAEGELLEADLCGAVYFDGLAPAPLGALDCAILLPLANAARSHRHARCGRSAMGFAAMDACDARIELLADAVREGDAAAATRAAGSLLGLGHGLTPSGDDMVCGFLLGRRAAAEHRGSADEAVERVAANASGLTTPVSAVQLALAAQGRFGEALLDVAEAFVTPSAAALGASVARCLAEGCSSGADGLLGFAAGVRACAAGSAADATADATATAGPAVDEPLAVAAGTRI